MAENKIFNPFKSKKNNFYETLINNLTDAIYLMDDNLRILFLNKTSEDISGYSQSELLGKKCPKNLLIQVGDQRLNLCIKDCPAKKTIKTGNTQHINAYIRHKEGYIVPVIMKVIPIKEKNNNIIGAVEIFSETSPKVSLPQIPTELKRMQLLDPLTNFGNKQYIEMIIHSRLNEMKKYKIPFGVLFIDIDNMQKINDNYGSVIGDKLLKTISQTIGNNIRFFEVVGRWNGEKFIVVLLNINSKNLDLISNKLRLLVEQSNIREHEKILRTTVSIGATLARTTDSIESLIKRTKDLSKQSKKLGKNRVSIST